MKNQPRRGVEGEAPSGFAGGGGDASPYIAITEKPLEVWKILQSVAAESAGGIVHFIGTVRKEKKLNGLFYECYPEMALKVLKENVAEAKKRWPIEKISLVHRYGWVEVGEPSIVIAVSSAHRREAFEACRFLIDRIKEEAPIWKREFSEKDLESLEKNHAR